MWRWEPTRRLPGWRGGRGCSPTAGAGGGTAEAATGPPAAPPRLAGVAVGADEAAAALSATAVIKLNGGLGTSMGIDRAKSLLPVRGDKSFLDVIVQQALAGRARTGARG